MPERSYRPLLLALALLGLTLDQASKYAVFAWLADKPADAQTRPYTFVLFRTVADPDIKGFALVAAQRVDGAYVNPGALFGIRMGMSPQSSNNFFAVVSLLAAVGIVIWSYQRSTARDRLLCAALGLILAGTLGNLYDRVVFQGVRDFLHWNYLYDWPVFNIADCCLVIGAALMLLQAFVLRSAPSAQKPLTPAAATLTTETSPDALASSAPVGESVRG
jgi:signal peptidase II